MNTTPVCGRRSRAHLKITASTSTLALFAAILGASGAHAQAAADGPISTTEVDAIEVVGFRQSLNQSSADKRRADQVVDVITAEEFGKFPDQNIAEAIQRIPGISMERTDGEGDRITIRGLEPDLTRVEINGRSTLVMGNVESPVMGSSLAIFGSDQFSKIEVVKTAQAKDNEGGVGGIVRLITAKPFDIDGFAARFSAQGRYNAYSGETDPVISIMASNRFLNDTLGLLVAASYDDRTRRSDQTRSIDGWLPAPTSQTGRPAALSLRGQTYATQFDQQFRFGSLPRTNLDLTAQYRPITAFELYLNANYAHEQRQESISRVAINTARNRPFIEGHANEAGTIDYVLVDQGQFTFQNRGLNRETDSYGLTIKPKWENDNWIVSGRLDYSLGQQIGYDRRIRSRMNRNIGYDLRSDPKSPVLIVPGLDLTNLSAFKIDKNLNEYGKARSSEFAYQGDVTRKLNGFFTEVRAGFKIRDNRVSAAQGPAEGPTNFTFADAVSPFPLNDFFKGHGSADFLRIWPYVDAQSFVDKYGPNEADARAAIDPALAYEVRYDVIAAYAQTSFEGQMPWADVRGNAGVRVVQTDHSGSGWENFLINGKKSVRAVESSNSFSNVLPNINVAFEPTAVDGLIVRLGAGRVMTHPRFTQINPTATISEDDLTLVRGNPDLKPFEANYYDAGLEYYFGNGNLVSVAFFHKDIDNFVEPVSYVEAYLFPGATTPEDVRTTTYSNGGEGKVSGVEFSLQMPFTFLPAPLDGFGGIFNYTRLDSSRALATGQDVEIPGNSPHTANATLYYEKGGFSARVAYNYRDTFLKEQFGPANNPVYVEGQGRIDLSAGYRLENGLSLTATVAISPKRTATNTRASRTGSCCTNSRTGRSPSASATPSDAVNAAAAGPAAAALPPYSRHRAA
ncbi:TonB-dependent receptor [Brevundimonas sp. 2YAF1]|uniref:TonB-dependent receptor n=1 Tax=Brevundimonas sp. 2YAF1 TaxID=3233024 RepID=UPI003F92F5F8